MYFVNVTLINGFSSSRSLRVQVMSPKLAVRGDGINVLIVFSMLIVERYVFTSIE